MPSPEPMDVDIAARADLEAQVPRASCLCSNILYPIARDFKNLSISGGCTHDDTCED